MRVRRLRVATVLVATTFSVAFGAQAPPAQNPSPPQASASAQGAVKITLDDAIKLALAHNHTLQAARTVIEQNHAEEMTANLRPNPVLSGDSQFLPIFNPSDFNSDYLSNTAQFDLGLSYLFERGRKRQHRLAAAKDVTAVSRAEVADNERTLGFSVASGFINVELAESTLALAEQDLASFRDTVGISEARYKAGDIGEGDLLKIRLQLLQFQTDVSAAKLARVQGLSDLRQLIGYESVPSDYDIAGSFAYVPVKGTVEDFQAKALATRPDLEAARLGVNAANSQYQLQKANGKRDVTGQVNYTHLTGINNLSLFGSIELPIFDRNQGEIARAGFAISQAQQQEQFASGQVMTDVRDAFEGLHSNDQIVGLYRSGYLDQARQSRDISEYAYKHGAASLLDFLDAERTYRSTELGYRQALAQYLLSLEQLREAVGTRNIP